VDIAGNLQSLVIALLAMVFFGVTGYISARAKPQSSTGWMHLSLVIIIGAALIDGLIKDTVTGVISAIVFAALATTALIAFLRRNRDRKVENH
jgi:hypothetical protein